MEGSLYDNLLKATNNVDDITPEKYGVITKLYGLYCNVKESGTGLEHSNVPIVNGANLSVGDKVIIGFINNSIYNVVVYGSLDKQVHDNTKQDQLISGTNIKTINSESILGSGNLVIQGGSSVDIVTEWETTLSDSKVASEKLTKDSLDGKADSSHTHTVSNITDFPSIPSDVSDLTDNNDVIPTKISDLTNDSDFIEKSNTTGLVKNDGTIDTTSYSTFSGSYNDLSNKPSIPSSSSDLSDGSDLVKKSNTAGLLKNDGTVDTNSYITSSSLPTKTSDLTNDGSSSSDSLVYVETSATSGLLKNDGSIDTNTYLTEMKIGSTSGLPVKTGTSGALTVGAFGTSSGQFAEGNHVHGQITTDGKITSTAVTMASSDDILITDYSDSNKVKRVESITAGHVKDGTAHSNIGSSANDTQATINGAIDTALSNKVSKSQTSGLLKNDGSVDTNTYLTSSSLSGYQTTSNLVTSFGSTTSDTKYPSEKLVSDSLAAKQATLVSGTSIKTINNESLLGSGNITIQGGSGGGGSYINNYYGDSSTNEIIIDYDTGVSQADIVTSWSSTVTDTNVPSEKLTKNSLDNKVDKSNTTGLLKNDGSVMTSGTGSSNYAAGNHTHTGYASSSHNHNITDLNNVTTVDVTVTYTNNTSETIKLMKYTGS